MRTTRSLRPALLLLAGLGACKPDSRFEALEIDSDFNEILVKSDAGEINLFPAEGDTLRIEMTLTGEHTGFNYEVKNDRLTVSRDCRFLHTGVCQVDFTIYAPPSLTADLRAGSGAVQVEDWQGPLSISSGSGLVSLAGLDGETLVQTGSGAILVEDAGGVIGLRTGSGDVVAQDLHSDAVEVQSSSGEVALTLDGAFTGLAVATGSGSVALTVPAGTYNVQIDQGSGELLTQGINQSSAVPSTIAVSSGSGDISIVGI